MSSRRACAAVLVAGLVVGCRTGQNYDDPQGPVYAGRMGGLPGCPPLTGDSIRVVTFNVEFALRVRGAADALANHPELRCADVVFLQEMDEVGTLRIASRLGVAYVYYPAVHHSRYGRDFGNAVLSRWPIEEHDKIILPHVSLLTRTQRTATAATLDLAGSPLRVYSTHLGSLLEVSGKARGEQLAVILADAADYPAAIIGGDMNSGSVGEGALAAGFDWPTAEGPATVQGRRWDHVLVRGPPARLRSGTVLDLPDVSDHRPVWLVIQRR